MAFDIIDRQPGGNSGTISIGSAGSATEVWTILADNFNYTTEDLRNSGVFPEVYTTFHGQNGLLRLMPIDIEQDADRPDLFIATLTWTSEKNNPQKEEEEKQKEDNPLDRRAKISVKTGKMRETKHTDFYGEPKTNSAGDLFDPPIESNSSFKIISIRKNVTVFPDWVFDFDDAVNSVPFTIKGRTIDTGCAWIANIELGEIQTDYAPSQYCEARIEIHVKKRRKPTAKEVSDGVTPPDPWRTEQLNEGLFCMEPTTADPTKFIKTRAQVWEDGSELKDPAERRKVNSPGPVLLTSTGRRLPDLTPTTLDSVTYRVFRDHEEKDFNDIAFLWSDA